MSTIFIDGAKPLVGTVTPSGAKNSAIKLIYAALYTNEDVLLENVPDILAVDEDLAVVRSLGAKADWAGNNRILINGASINSYEVPSEIGSRYRTTLLAAGPLLYRFGRAILPKPMGTDKKVHPHNRLVETWTNLGIKVEDKGEFYELDSTEARSGNIYFRTSSHLGTDNAIISSLFLPGETTISNASEESEVDDLLEFCSGMGVKIEQPETRKLVIHGTTQFKGGRFVVQSDKTEIAIFAAASLITKGNLIIRKVNRTTMVPFVNFLNKIGSRFEFSGDELKVWYHDEPFKPQNLIISPTPGFVSDWQPLASLILAFAEGESIVHDTVNIERFDYIKDLNRMGARMETLKPSEAGIVPVISDDSYNFSSEGEPEIALKIKGPVRLKGEKLNIQNFLSGPILVLAALAAEGRSELTGFDHVRKYMEGFDDKLLSIGANLWKTQG
jgi:UDP-N-acetylglucosamine 1-carboxyvinyltransferase